ncbi:MAG: hypothetical protein WBP41_01725 [Saprospiraceae bacterium]
MKNVIAIIFSILIIISEVSAHVIYERTYEDAFPSIRNSIELSNGSTFSLFHPENQELFLCTPGQMK